LKQRILRFDGEAITRLSVEAPGPIRWIVRTGDQGDLLVGDRGGVFRYEGKNLERLPSPTTQNLRCVAVSPKDGIGYACGNNGTVLRIEHDTVSAPNLKLRENLRRLAWDSTGEQLLVVGNGGSAYVLDARGAAKTVFGADTNLRSIAWHPSKKTALVTGNCFRDGIGSLTPSPNLFELEDHSLREVSTLAESSADLTASSWHPDGSSCLLAGFDQTWHTPALFTYSQGRMNVVEWNEPAVFPTACAWSPDGRTALVGTSPMTGDEGAASLYRYSAGTLEKLAGLNGFGVSCIAWGTDGTALVACSRTNRAFTS
jgi:WD40 repeat protein